MDSFSVCYDDAFGYIFNHLSVVEIALLSPVCKRFKMLSNQRIELELFSEKAPCLRPVPKGWPRGTGINALIQRGNLFVPVGNIIEECISAQKVAPIRFFCDRGFDLSGYIALVTEQGTVEMLDLLIQRLGQDERVLQIGKSVGWAIAQDRPHVLEFLYRSYPKELENHRICFEETRPFTVGVSKVLSLYAKADVRALRHARSTLELRDLILRRRKTSRRRTRGHVSLFADFGRLSSSSGRTNSSWLE